jgi:glutamine synthetase type III
MSDLPRSGLKCFCNTTLVRRLTDSFYGRFLKTVQLSAPLDRDIAPEVAKAMLNWAVSLGVTTGSSR